MDQRPIYSEAGVEWVPVAPPGPIAVEPSQADLSSLRNGLGSNDYEQLTNTDRKLLEAASEYLANIDTNEDDQRPYFVDSLIGAGNYELF